MSLMTQEGSLRRIGALVLRYLYLYKGSWPRMLDLVYWPAVQMILWGFINQYLAAQASYPARAFGLVIAAVLLWDILFRSQLGVSLTFFEEVYSRNLGHLFVSPLRPWELVAAFLTMSFLRTLVGVGSASLLAIPLYHYNVFHLGAPLVAYFGLLLVMGWALGVMIVALVLWNGMGAEGMAWVIIFALAPVSGVYYPIGLLPDWLHPVAWSLPSAHVFEGMRAVLLTGVFDWGHFWAALALDGFYMALGAGVFLWVFRQARKKGLLLDLGE